MKRWQQKRTKINVDAIATDMGIQKATATVLANRKLFTKKAAHAFLYPEQADFYPTEEMLGVEKGLELLTIAIKKGKKIAVYGDYDVDGVMSTTILCKAITKCGGTVQYYIPHRQQEGYGLNEKAVETLANDGVEVLFTCDNGISALQEVALAKKMGMEVVILDHHEPLCKAGKDGEWIDILPEGDAVIDPKQRICTYPFGALCAGGIAYKFAICLLHRFGYYEEVLEKELISFAAIATVCDIVDLLEENRTLVKMGLSAIQHTTNTGLRVLIEETNLQDRTITEYHLGFVIGPCVNATGRLESGKMAVDLFCEQNIDKARDMAHHLVQLNEERKTLTAQAVERITEQIEQSDALQQKVLVLYDSQTHESIAGIVAGRIKDKYYRPTILITDAEEGAKGSARSIVGYHIFEALLACQALFTRFGGHAMAAGLSLPHENIPILRQKLNENCALTENDMIPVLRIEKIMTFDEIHMVLAEELQMLSPFGKENPSPLFASQKIWIERLRCVGKNKDILQMVLREEESNMRLSAISFDGLEQMQNLLKELYPVADCDTIIQSGSLPMAFDMVYSIDINAYNGRKNVQLVIKDFRVSK